MKNKLLISIIIAFLSVSPCFADAGIPLWLFSNSSSFLATGIQWKESFMLFSTITIFLLLIVSLVETLVIKSILKINNFVKAFEITLKANIISTIIGTIVTLFITNNSHIVSWLWWDYKWSVLNLLILHIAMLILSYFIEYNVAKKSLNDYKTSEIKKSFLLANILSYIVFPFIIIGSIIIADFKSMQVNQSYEKINYTSIDDIEVVKPAFIPKPVDIRECKKIRKELGIDVTCDAEIDYWTGAVKACGGVEHLYSQNQIQKIIYKVYNVDTTDYNVTGDFFHKELAEEYGLPIDFLPPELLKEHEYSEAEYQEYVKHFPMKADIWINRAPSTTRPYIGSLYSRSGHVQTFSTDIGEYSKTYAICINNKNIPASKPKKKYLR